MLTLALACGPSRRTTGDEVVIAAAASLGDAIVALTPLAEERGLALVVNAAGSNVLAQQIEAARFADVFLSADAAWIDHLEGLDLLRAETRSAFLTNRLVIIGHGPSGDPLPIERLAEPGTGLLVLADPDAVPAGRYARAALRSVALATGGSLWDRLADRIVPTADVRAALALVDAQSDARGIVYATDAAFARSARVLSEIPTDLGPPIRYVAAAVAHRPDPALADRFLRLLASSEARSVFERHGFEAPD